MHILQRLHGCCGGRGASPVVASCDDEALSCLQILLRGADPPARKNTQKQVENWCRCHACPNERFLARNKSFAQGRACYPSEWSKATNHTMPFAERWSRVYAFD